jgi:hypothetical protein
MLSTLDAWRFLDFEEGPSKSKDTSTLNERNTEKFSRHHAMLIQDHKELTKYIQELSEEIGDLDPVKLGQFSTKRIKTSVALGYVEKALKDRCLAFLPFNGMFLHIIQGFESSDPEALDLHNLYKNLSRVILNFKDVVQKKLQDSWNALEVMPEPEDKTKNLLWKLMRPDPNQRITAQQALDIINTW